jgi:hypothetical protein
VGIHASGQAYEMLLMRMFGHPLAEVRSYAHLMLAELRKVIPSFLRRVDMDGRGRQWTDYLAATAERMRQVADDVDLSAEDRPEVDLVAWDHDAERKVAAGALYAVTDLPDDQIRRYVERLSEDDIGRILTAYAGERGNRRHKPGREPATASTSSATTASSATCSATGCSPSNGRSSARTTAT